jgi:hypothetical protein
MKTNITFELTHEEVCEQIRNGIERDGDGIIGCAKFQSIQITDDGGAILIYEEE